MSAILKRLRSLFAWRAIRNSGAWLYLQNDITGQRKAIWLRGCYQPLNRDWMRGGDIVIGPRGRYVIGTEGEIIHG